MANGNGNGKRNYGEWSKDELIKEVEALKKQKTYGLVWEREKTKEVFDYFINWDGEKTKEVFPESQNKFPVLKEVKSKDITSDKSGKFNILIEGDNYHSLAVLNFTHDKSIDLVYIDPPYNTGNKDFKYNDVYVEKDDAYRHSKWLSFMERRLRLARTLLKDTGVIFISINEQELCQLKLLCDEIFGEENYLTMFTIKVRHEDRILKGDKDFHEVVEYLLLYRRSDRHKTVKRIRDNTSIAEYLYAVKELTDNPQKIEMGNKRVEIFKPTQFEIIKKEANESLFKKINIRGSIKEGNSSGRFYMKYLDKLTDKKGYLYKCMDMGDDGKGYRYFLIPDSEKRVNGDYFQGVPLSREDTKEIPYPNYLDFEDEFNNVGYEGGIEFRNGKKPVNFILKIFEIGGVFNNKNAVILDFFSGSGSTGHAVLERNKEDGGDRRFILCTDNEANICEEVCYPRLKNAISGFKLRKEEISGLGGNLKYFKTDFVEAEPTDANKRKMVDKSTEMLCIKENAFEFVAQGDGFKIFKNDAVHVGIIFDDEEIGGFVKEAKKIKGRFNVYVFSLDDTVPSKEFKELKGRVSLCPIPEVILHVYRRVFKND